MAPDTRHDAAPPAPDYKDTLNLPRTDFPMRAGLPEREPRWLARWSDLGVYARLRSTSGNRPPFVLHDGPPYANAHLHVGHGLNKVLKDMVARSRQMMGRDSRFVPGWDCHGLPIEWRIEEQYRARGQNKDEVPVVDFRQECRRFAEHWVGVQREEFRRLGVTGDWDRPYLTMDFHAEAVIAAEFHKFLMNGSLYQGSKPVMWSPVERTALAEAEVEYHDKESPTIWVRFRVQSYEDMKRQDGDSAFVTDPYRILGSDIIVWTTTPWTIPGNKGVAYNPEIDYSVFEVLATQEESWAKPGDKLILADALADETLKRARITQTLQWPVPREAFTGMTVAHPWYDQPWAKFHGTEQGIWDEERPVLAADFVTADAGTGFVHTAPSHGLEDYELFVRNHLASEMTHWVDEDSAFQIGLPDWLAGTRVILPDGKDGGANQAVIEKLIEARALLARGRVKHSYPHSWRSKAPLIYRNTPQWFAAIDKPLGDGKDAYGETIRQRALESIEKLVEFTPVSGRNRLHSMMQSRPDWVLSRQRAWGVPLACFTKRGAKPTDPDFLLRDERVNERVVAIFEAEGADAWYPNVPFRALGNPGTPDEEALKAQTKARFLDGLADPDQYDQVFDILDVWFDSGSTHAFVLRDREDGSPDGLADLYLEGTDQHRGWFHSSLLQACGTIGRAPYRAVLTHGFTLDERGQKMSKSLGNTVAPAEVVRQYGADILRLWVAQSDYTADLRIGPDILKGAADSYRRLRNTLRFLLGSLADATPTDAVGPDAMPELERWVLHRLAELDAEVRAGYEAYDFTGVFRALFEFATADLSAFYLDVRKDALYCDGDTPRRRAARAVLGHVFDRLAAWLAPILPFTMEEAWLERHEEEGSIHLHDFPPTPPEWRDARLAARWERVRAARRVVTGALEVQRTAKVIGASLEAAPALHVEDPAALAGLGAQDWADLCITSALSPSTDPAPSGAFRLPDVPGVAVAFALAEGDKCARCWKVLPDVGAHAHPGVCARCNAALAERDGSRDGGRGATA